MARGITLADTGPATDVKPIEVAINDLATDFKVACAHEGLQVYTYKPYRNLDEQRILFERYQLYIHGKAISPPPQIAGEVYFDKKLNKYISTSKHPYYGAFDWCPMKPIKNGSQELKNVLTTEDDELWAKGAEIGKKLGLDSGYYWGNGNDKHPKQDKVHMELPISLTELRKPGLMINLASVNKYIASIQNTTSAPTFVASTSSSTTGCMKSSST
jgi:hypothetical protein